LLISPEAIRLAKLTQKWGPSSSREILFNLLWSLPDSVETIREIPVEDLILIYRMIDSNLLFPSHDERYKFNQLLIEKMSLLPTVDEKICAMESLLFVTESKFITPISAINFRSKLIDAWVSLLAIKYGKDNSSDIYFANLKLVIDRINKNAPSRDITKMLSSLANAIVSQWQVSEYLGILLEPDKFMIIDRRERDMYAITTLGAISNIMNDNKQDQQQMLNYFAAPITHESVVSFANYLLNQHLARKLLG
jgi:hypothetical protein